MMEGPVTLNVHFEAVPGQEQDLARELPALVETTRKEAGAITLEAW
jgi:quinol monooxygenase YgiN